MQTFRFLVERGSQAKILAGEEALLDSVSSGADPILRFVIFDPTAVLLGYHQAVDLEVNLEEVKKRSWEVGRRPTGGGTIIMGPFQLGWEIYFKTREDPIQLGAKGVINTLKKLNLDARFRPKNDVEINGRKISGIGAFSIGDFVAVTGTIILDFNVDDMVATLKLSSEKMKDKVVKDYRERVTWVNRELKTPIEMSQLIPLAREGFEEALGVKLVDADYTPQEKEEIERLALKYASPEWVFNARQTLKGNIRQAEMKFPGGLVKVQAKVTGRIIEAVLITGDFFVEPRRAIYDLEARLKWSKVEDVQREVEEWFKGVKILGITKDDLVKVIMEAVK
ncbi:MAG: lipoate--protein ligase [Candidatus Aramenus sp.]|jgi:lipoate-protein ligase A|nr:lipoate--protein ligase [Candidatus Aramenus sp.]